VRRSLAATLLALALVGPASTGPALAVVGGAEADGPAAGAVMVLSSRGGVCTGIVLAPTVVLTAGHCASGGEHRIHYKEGAEPVLAALSGTAVHPGYDAGAVEGRRVSIDLALVRTAAPLPARFVPQALSATPAAAGDALGLGGYGAARVGDARSTGTYRTATLPVVEPYGRGKILVWLQGRGSGACGGDSGGPIGRDGAVVAVAGWARGEGGRAAGCGGLTQGVLVGPQRAWIDATLARWGAAARWE
jgi:hypothetical protein